MACKICGRGACTESFHSIEAQEQYEKEQEEKQDRREEEYLKVMGREDPDE